MKWLKERIWGCHDCCPHFQGDITRNDVVLFCRSVSSSKASGDRAWLTNFANFLQMSGRRRRTTASGKPSRQSAPLIPWSSWPAPSMDGWLTVGASRGTTATWAASRTCFTLPTLVVRAPTSATSPSPIKPSTEPSPRLAPRTYDAIWGPPTPAGKVGDQYTTQ